MYDLTVSIVNFNSDQELSRCLESFYSYAPDLKYKITVVDNNSEKSSLNKTFVSGVVPGNIVGAGVTDGVCVTDGGIGVFVESAAV